MIARDTKQLNGLALIASYSKLNAQDQDQADRKMAYMQRWIGKKKIQE